MPTTIEELLEQSKQCHNYLRYDPDHWSLIARYLVLEHNIVTAYIILDSKHMRWNPDRTLVGFINYAIEHLTPDEVTFLIESVK
jgi:hypothetical protein